MANNQSVRRHLDAFTRGRIIGKLEEGRSVTSVAAEFELLTASFHDFRDNFKLQEQLSGGSVVVVHKEPHPQMTEDCTVVVCLHDALYGCTFNACSSEKTFSVVPGTPELRDNEWGRVLFTDESRFSLSSDSHRILIWRERGSCNHPSNIIERDRYGGHGVLVWGGIMLGSRTDLHIFDAGSVNGTRYCNEILLPYVLLLEALWVCSSFSWTTMHHVIAQ
ncbi:transposable element Tc1 transposase [Trichonephila clavipes]|nr:transposable element Tc1 transposase [Trichonephila clavipes]